MNRHDPKSMSAELPWSVDEFVAFNRVQAATHIVEFWAQEQRLKQLNDYCDRAVAEIRASLDRTQDDQARYCDLSPIPIDYQEEGFYHGLPLLEILLGFRQAGDVVAGIAQSHDLAPTRQQDSETTSTVSNRLQTRD